MKELLLGEGERHLLKSPRGPKENRGRRTHRRRRLCKEFRSRARTSRSRTRVRCGAMGVGWLAEGSQGSG